MLPDYKAGLLFSPLRQRHLHVVMLQATFASGVATVDTANSSPGVTFAKTGTGLYSMTFPKGQTAHYLGGEVANSAGGIGNAVYLLTSSATGGTATFEFDVNTAAATAADPADTCRVFITFLLGKI